MNIYNIYNKIKIEMSTSIRILLLVMLIIPFLSGCRVDEADYELTNYTGKSISTFEKRTKTELAEDSNGVYTLDSVLQLIAPKGKITSFAILEGSEKYKLFGVLDEEIRGRSKLLCLWSETNKTINRENSVPYLSTRKASYISYDIDTELKRFLTFLLRIQGQMMTWKCL